MPEGRCDLVLLGWTAFISFNLASDYFWSSHSQEADEQRGFVNSPDMGTPDIYTGQYKLESNGSLIEEGDVRMLLGTSPTSMMSVHMSKATLSLAPKEQRQSYHSLQPHIYFSGVEFGGAGRLVAAGTTVPRTFQHFPNRVCQLQASFDTGLEASQPEHLGDHSPAARISGEINAVECDFTLHFDTRIVDTAYLSQRVVHYSIWSNLIILVQIRCFLAQIRHSEDGPAIAKVSMACIGFQALMDAYDSFLHICLGLSSQYMFYSMALIALFKCLIFSFLEARYLLIILRHRRHEAFSEGWESVRREVSWLYTRFYGVLVLGLMFIYHSLKRLDIIVLVLQAYWLPQIAWDAWQGTRGSLNVSFIIGISASRLLVPLYLWGCPNNIFSGEIYPRLPGAPSLQWCLLLVGIQAAQVITMFLQQRLGPRWFVPWVCMPWAYNYHRHMAVDSGTDCVICMAEMDPEEGGRVVTPCSHSFHQACLEQWMEVKMECPTCRAALPPIQ